MTDLQESKRGVDSVTEIAATLDRLIDHGFLTSWRREGRRWHIQAGAAYGPYTTREAFGFIEGARAMGANV